MNLKYFACLFLFLNVIIAFAQDKEEIPDEFRIKFNSKLFYEVDSDNFVDGKSNTEIIFYKNKTTEFEIIFEDGGLLLKQVGGVESLTINSSGRSFTRIYLTNNNGVKFLMDYFDDNDYEVKLFEDVKDDKTFTKSYMFYNEE